MKFYALKCPNCDAPIKEVDGITEYHCEHCGYHIVLSGQTEAEIGAKVAVKSYEHQERILDKKYEHEKFVLEHKNKNEKRKTKQELFITIVAVALACLFLSWFFISGKLDSDRQEQELQLIVDEVLDDINNGDYTSAYIKANTIYYTENWSDEIKEKWDKMRESLIEQIEKAEKAEKAEDYEDSEDDSWFNWFN